MISGGNRWRLYSDERLLITHCHSGAVKLSVPSCPIDYRPVTDQTEIDREAIIKQEFWPVLGNAPYSPRRLRSAHSLQSGFPSVPPHIRTSILRIYSIASIFPVSHFVLLWCTPESVQCHGILVGISEPSIGILLDLQFLSDTNCHEDGVYLTSWTLT